MPRATIASRTLKNKDTCLDLFIPSYKETKGLVTNIVHYQVVLVSSISCFKAPSHKETDVVQYSVEKKFGEFEELRNKISEQFSGTVLPPISKKSLIVNDAVLRERRNVLEAFVKFLAKTKKLSTCQPLLEFLGVDIIRAKKYSRGESLEQNKSNSGTEQENEEEDEVPDTNVFGEEEDNIAEDIFGEDEELEKTGEDSIFQSGGIGVFDGQDLKRELTEEDEADFTTFITDAIVSKKVSDKPKVQDEEEDDNHSDLFDFNDDLDQLMNVPISKKSKETSGPSTESSETPQSLNDAIKELPSTKPKVAQKPQVPTKPSIAKKPTVPSKPHLRPKANESAEQSTNGTSQKSKVQSGSNEGKSSKGGDSPVESNSASFDHLGQDDILKYLQAQSESTSNDDLDLFS